MEVQKKLFLLAVAFITTATAAYPVVNGTNHRISADNPVVQAGASGPGVVDAVVDLIYHSCIFPDDYLFLRRLAYAATRDGMSPYTYDSNTNGGIWRVNQNMFQSKQGSLTLVSSSLLAKYRQIEEAFGIAWQNVQWNDIQKPLYSALAAMLYFTDTGRPIPSSAEEQATYWHNVYQGSAAGFVHDFWNGACSGTEQADVVFVIDSATSNDNFRRTLTYVRSVVDGLTLNSELIRVALYQFGSGILHNEFQLSSGGKNAVLAAIDNLSQMAGGSTGISDTGNLLQTVMAETFPNTRRPNAARIIVLVTENQPSNMVSLQGARDLAVNNGVSVFTVGVGSGSVLLNSLATVATQPACDHQLKVEQFQHLIDIVQETQFKICREPMIASGRIQCRLDQCRNLAFRITSQEMTMKFETTCGSGNIYISPRSPRPDQYFRDAAGVLITSPDVGSVPIIANSPYMYATFVEATSGTSSCYATIELVNGISTDYTCPTVPPPLTNPCLTVGRTVDRFPYPYSTRIYILCDWENVMYLTYCPDDRPYFNQDCRYCVGPNSPILYGCGTQPTFGYCGHPVNPCTEESRRNKQYYFACPSDEHEYLMCDTWGNAYIRSCPVNEVWRENTLTCEVLPLAINPCNGISKYFPYDADVHKYIMCDENRLPTLMTCQLNYIWDQAQQGCVPPGPVHVTSAPTQAPVSTKNGILLNRGFMEPCTRENIQADKLYFPYIPDETKYIQCDLWGDAYLMSCQPGFYFLPASSTCV